MIALKVAKNGARLCLAGAEDMGILTANVVASGVLGTKSKKSREDQAIDFRMRVGGLTARHDAPDDHLNWSEGVELGIGDRIEIEIVETVEADKPESISPQDEKRAKENLKERFDYAKTFYFQFKDQFENEES